MRSVLALIGAAVLTLTSAPALAAPVQGDVFNLPGYANRLALGPDGNMWVTFENHPDNKDVARVTPAGVINDFEVTANTGVGGIVAGPDGNLWITDLGRVIEIPPSDPESETPHDLTGFGQGEGITVGPDGNLWATSGGAKLVRFSPADPEGTDQAFAAITTAANTANGIVAGTDGRVWVADASGAVVSVTTDGSFAPHPMPDVDGDSNPDGAPQDVTAGPAGQVLYTNATSSPNTVGRLVDDSLPVFTELPGTDPFGAVFANDGAYWIAQFNGKNLGRMTPGGEYSTFGDYSANTHFPRNVARGAGDDLWVILDKPGETFTKIARITGVSAPGGPISATPGTSGKDGTAPNVTNVLIASAFSVGTRRTPVSLRTPIGVSSAVGTRIRFRLSEAATVRLRFDRVLPGRRRGRRCVAPRRNNRGARRCTRYRRAGATLRRVGVAGANVVPFSGRIGRRALRLGRHRLTIEATDTAGNSAKRTKRFRIVPRRARR